MVAKSSMEAKYMAASSAGQTALFLHTLMREMGLNFHAPTVIYCNNNSAITLTCNPKHHQKARHINTKYHFACDHVVKNNLTYKYV